MVSKKYEWLLVHHAVNKLMSKYNYIKTLSPKGKNVDNYTQNTIVRTPQKNDAQVFDLVDDKGKVIMQSGVDDEIAVKEDSINTFPFNLVKKNYDPIKHSIFNLNNDYTNQLIVTHFQFKFYLQGGQNRQSLIFNGLQLNMVRLMFKLCNGYFISHPFQMKRYMISVKND